MAHRLEDLFALKVARQLKIEVYTLLRQSRAHRDLEFAGQLRAAAASIESNIAEGYRRPKRDFARFLLIARTSLDEVEVRLRDGVDRGHYGPETVARFDGQLRLTTAAIMRLRRSLLTRGE